MGTEQEWIVRRGHVGQASRVRLGVLGVELEEVRDEETQRTIKERNGGIRDVQNRVRSKPQKRETYSEGGEKAQEEKRKGGLS